MWWNNIDNPLDWNCKQNLQASEKRLKEIHQTIYLFAQMQTNPANLGTCLLMQPNASCNLSQYMGQVNVFTVC